MNRKIVGAVGLALGLSAVSAPTLAQNWYVGASAGSADPDLGLLDNDVGVKLFGGYRFNRNFSAEVGYMMIGELEFTGGDVEIDGLEASAVGRLPINPDWSVFGRAGLFAWDREVSGVAAQFVDDDGVDFTWGVGAEYALTNQVGLQAAWQRFLDVEGDIDYLSLGATFSF